jgi:hypothetical protein
MLPGTNSKQAKCRQHTCLVNLETTPHHTRAGRGTTTLQHGCNSRGIAADLLLWVYDKEVAPAHTAHTSASKQLTQPNTPRRPRPQTTGETHLWVQCA